MESQKLSRSAQLLDVSFLARFFYFSTFENALYRESLMALQTVRIVVYATLLTFMMAFGLGQAAIAGGMAASNNAMNSVGLNKFDLFMQYLGTASKGDGSEAYQRVARAMARKALEDAQEAGIKLMRVSVAGYSPARYGGRRDLELWMTSPDIFWPNMDKMFDDLDETNIQLVPVLMWNSVQFPAMAGETVGDLIRNPDSKSWKLLSSYVTDFVLRYRGRRTIAFYELTNELNLLVDLDNVTRCERLRSAGQCKLSANFSTDDLIEFTKRYAALIRRLDGARLISSGFSIPRGSAEHLSASRRRNERPDWTPDTRGQFRKNLREIHAAVDILSIHLYPGKQNRRFGSSSEMEVLAEARLASEEAGKPLFVGEFGEPDTTVANPDTFTAQMMKKIVELNIPYSAVWAWEIYQHKLFKADRRDHAYNLEPGYTDFLIGRIRETNLGSVSAAGRNSVTNKPPRVVLTWPLECSILRASVDLFAVASDDSGSVVKVQFLVDGQVIGEDGKPPYQTTLDSSSLADGAHRLSARAIDEAGMSAEFTSSVLTGGRRRQEFGGCQ